MHLQRDKKSQKWNEQSLPQNQMLPGGINKKNTGQRKNLYFKNASWLVSSRMKISQSQNTSGLLCLLLWYTQYLLVLLTTPAHTSYQRRNMLLLLQRERFSKANIIFSDFKGLSWVMYAVSWVARISLQKNLHNI